MSLPYNYLGRGYDQLYGAEQDEKYQAIFQKLPCPPGWHVLDVGHATGRIHAWLPHCHILGTDTAAELLTHSPCETLLHNMNQPFPFPSKTFDLVVSITAFHHAMRPEAVLREFLRLARKRIIISLHTRLQSTQQLKSLLEAEGFSAFPAGVDIAFWKDLV